MVQVVVTGSFAGTERYVCSVAGELAARDWESSVIGGDPGRMRAVLPATVRWLPGATPPAALRSLARLGRQDVCHAHLTYAETVAVATRPLHRAPVVATRHFAAHRGATRLGGLLAPLIAAGVAREVAVSDFVARSLERPPAAVVTSGVPPSPLRWRSESRVVLVLQRLEREKDTLTALRAWQLSGLADAGWQLRVVGEGSERAALEEWMRRERCVGVAFVGYSDRVPEELAGAAVLLAPAPAEPFGLGVVEAMAAGVPVVAAAAGGHLETVGLAASAPRFSPGDAAGAAEALRVMLSDELRATVSAECRAVASDRLTLGRQVDELIAVYGSASPRLAHFSHAEAVA